MKISKAKIPGIILKILFVAGTTGFPAGISGLVKNFYFSGQKPLTKLQEEIKDAQKFLNETSKEEQEKIKNEISDLNEQLDSERKQMNQGIGTSAKNFSSQIKKIMKIGIQSCKNKESLGLIQVKEKLKLGNKEEEIEYCYYLECDGNLFSKKLTSTPITDTLYHITSFDKSCFSAVINHDESNKQITGTIKFGVKDTTKKSSGASMLGELIVTDFKFTSDNKNEFKNRLISFKESNGKWNVEKGCECIDSYKSHYTYNYFKDRFPNGYKKLGVWEREKNFKSWSIKKEKFVIFDKGSDLWDWNFSEQKSTYQSECVKRQLSLWKTLRRFSEFNYKEIDDSWWIVH